MMTSGGGLTNTGSLISNCFPTLMESRSGSNTGFLKLTASVREDRPMAAQTTERAFETYVQEIFISGGWVSGSNAGWDKVRALFPAQVLAFVGSTQPDLWEEMKRLHASGLEPLFLTTLVKELDAKGSLHVLRHGFKFYGKTFRLSYFKPAHGANPEVLELFAKNECTVTRQVPCHPSDNRTLDIDR